MQAERLLRPEAQPGLFAPGDAAMVVHPVAADGHGVDLGARAEDRIVGPQRGTRKTHARNHDRFVLQEMHPEPRRLGPRQLELLGVDAVIIFMVTHHHDDRHVLRHDLAQARKAVHRPLADILMSAMSAWRSEKMWRCMGGREVEPRTRCVGRVSEA